MARNFREYIAAFAPPWLAKGFGERLLGAFGFFADIHAESASEAIVASYVNSATSPSDALPGIGANANLERIDLATDGAYRDFLANKWDVWEDDSATRRFAERAVEQLGIEPSQVTLLTPIDGASFTGDGWSRWAVVLTEPLPWLEGVGPTNDEIFGVMRLLCKLKSAHELGLEVILLYGAATIWGAGTWGAPRVWTSAGTIYRFPLARRWGADFPFATWNADDHYRPAFKDIWGGKIRV